MARMTLNKTLYNGGLMQVQYKYNISTAQTIIPLATITLVVSINAYKNVCLKICVNRWNSHLQSHKEKLHLSQNLHSVKIITFGITFKSTEFKILGTHLLTFNKIRTLWSAWPHINKAGRWFFFFLNYLHAHNKND